MKFKSDDLREIVFDDWELEDGSTTKLVFEEECGGKHDSTEHYVVFSHNKDGATRFFEASFEISYNEGLQEYWDDEQECREVVPYQETITKYRAVA